MANVENRPGKAISKIGSAVEWAVNVSHQNWNERNVPRKSLFVAEVLLAFAVIKYLTSSIYDVALYDNSELAKVDLTHAAVAAVIGTGILITDRFIKKRSQAKSN